jgi:hypothetical protein
MTAANDNGVTIAVLDLEALDAEIDAVARAVRMAGECGFVGTLADIWTELQVRSGYFP